MMSFFVTRPPVPVPGTVEGSMPCSAAMRATTGETNVFPFPVAAGATGAGAAAGSATGAAAGAGGRRCRHRLGRRRHGLGRSGSRLDGRGRRCDAGWRDDGEDCPDLDRLTLLHEDLSDDSLGRARHLGVDLVRGDLEQRLVAADRLSDLLEPLRDRSFGDGDAHLGHHDLGLGSCRHGSS